MAKTASVFIDGEIKPPSDEYYGYNNIAGIRSQIEWQGHFEEIEVTINSNGGDIAEGLGIYDLLRSYGVPITTTVIGQCCSAATIVFLAGKVRIIYENVVGFMVHKASGGGQGTAEDLRKIADFIDSYNDRMANVYAEATGKDSATVAGWLSNGDLYMTAQEAFDNGFATSIAKPIEAKAYASRPATTPTATTPATATTSESSLMKMFFNKAQRLIASVQAMSDGKKAVPETVKTSSGDEITIDRHGESIAEGDTITKKGGGALSDGEITLENGAKITIKDGKVEVINTDGVTDPTAQADADNPTAQADAPTTETTTETTTTDAPPADDAATLKAENERLTSENESLKTQQTAMESRVSTVEAKLRQVTALAATISSQPVNTSATNNSARPNPVTAKSTGGKTAEEESREKMLNERKNRGLGTQSADE